MRKIIIASIFIITICTLSACTKKSDTFTEENKIQAEISSEKLDYNITAPITSNLTDENNENSFIEESSNDETSYNITQVNDWFTIELPERYTLSEYNENVGNEGGFLIEPKAYEVLSEDSYGYGMDWTMSGSIGIIKSVPDVFIYDISETDKVTGVMSLWNHCSLEKIEILDNFDMPAVLYSGNHDLYTAADMGNLEEQGINLQPEDTTSDYWYIFFTKEDGSVGYYLALDQRQFSQEDAINIANTVKFIT